MTRWLGKQWEYRFVCLLLLTVVVDFEVEEIDTAVFDIAEKVNHPDTNDNETTTSLPSYNTID